jgi:hypothetical protein
MKIKNLLLLVVLLNVFAARPSFGAGVRVAPGEVEAPGEEEHKGAEAEDAPLRAGAGTGLGGGAEGAAVGVVGGAEGAPVVVSQGALAKIELLRGSLTGAPPAMQGASLLHGAMLWEMNIVKMLYVLLVTPKEVEVAGEVRLEPDAENTLFLLGKVLIKFFRLTGEAFKPSSAESVVSVHLTPETLGQLYKALMNGEEIPEPFNGPRPKKVKNVRIEEYKTALMNCKINTELNPKNLLPSIIMAFFWAKFVMGAPFAQAQANIAIFMKTACDGLREDEAGATSAAPASASGAGATVVEGAVDPDVPAKEPKNLAEVEAEIIARIKVLYQYNIPKPPFQGNAIIPPLPGTETPRSFPDCGESGIRGLFCAAFYEKDNNSFVVPADTDSRLYRPELRAYFEKHSTAH